MASIEDWKRAVPTHSEDPVHAEAADAMALMLKGEVGPEDTAKRIAEIYGTELKSNNDSPDMNDEEQVNYFWTYLMCDAIFTFSSAEQHERLFDLLVAISKQPDVKTPNGSVKKYCDHDVYWRDLPGWSLSFATQASCESTPSHYFGDFADINTPVYEKAHQWTEHWLEDYLNQAPRLLNGTKFAAMLLEKNVFTINLPMEASDALKLGIEKLCTDKSNHYINSIEAQVLLPATTTWLLVAGKMIYSHCLNNEIERYGADLKTRQGWGRGTWTIDRWEGWQERLHEIADLDDVNEECRDIALKTLRKMAAIEAEHDSR